MIQLLGTTLAALLGLAFGSFLNVCLSRWPEGESIVRPRSHCRSCSHTLAWWENVPLLSWLILRGRCRKCHAWIGLRNPLVELAVAALWASTAWHALRAANHPDLVSSLSYSYYGLADVIGKMIFYWMMIALAILDAENLWLPDWITIPGTALGFFFAVLVGPLDDAWWFLRNTATQAALDEMLAILIAAGLMLLIRSVYWLIQRREGLGLGDVKLMAMLAAWLGLLPAVLAFGLAAVLGSLVALVMLLAPSKPAGADGWALKKLPLGTFLCVGGIVSALWGQPIIAAYRNWVGF
jgi:leader peptidase (prepilin peptidase)/N-methyltransferase